MKKAQGPLRTLPFAQVDKANYDYQFGYKETFGEADYLPKASVNNSKKLNSILNHVGYISGRHIKLHPISRPNQLAYHLNSNVDNNVVDLPAVAYKGTYVKVNGISRHFKHSDRGTVKVKLTKGENNVVVGYSPNIFSMFSL